MIGTAGSDTFTSDHATFGASDTINGGAGVDTLNYTDSSTTGVAPLGLVQSVEIINIRNANGSAVVPAVNAVAEKATVTFNAVTVAGVAAGAAVNTTTITIAGRVATLTGAAATGAAAAATADTVYTAAAIASAFAAAAAVNAAAGTVGITASSTLVNYAIAAGTPAAGTAVLDSTVAGNVTNLTTAISTGVAPAVSVVDGVVGAGASGGAGIPLTVNASNFAGATDFNSNLSTQIVNFTNVAATQKVGIIGNGAAANGNISAAYVTTATASTVNVAGGVGPTGTTAPTVTITGGTVLASSTINSTGTVANTLGGVALGGSATSLTINAAANLTTGLVTGFTGTTATITVAGSAASVNLGVIEAATVKTIAASGLTAGGVTATLNNNTLFNFTGGAGNDIITLGAVLVTGAIVDAGAGTADRLIVADSTHVTAATAPFIKGFEVVQANTGVTVDVSQLAAFNTITGIRVNDSASAAVAVNGLTAAQAANVAIIAAADANGAITLGLTGATTGGQIDTVNATLTTTNATTGLAQVSNLTGIVLTGVEKLILTGSNTATATTGAVTLTTTAATSLDTITLTNAGVNSIVIASTQTATNLNVDASASIGNTTIDASAYATATGASLKGGSGHDIIIGSERGDNIVGGAGNDVLSGTAITLANITAGTATAVGTIGAAPTLVASTNADTFTGGAGLDVFAIGVGAITTMSTITDLNLGTAVVGGGVDRIVTDSTASAVTVVTFTAAQQATITAAATFSLALDAAINAFGAVAAVASTFTYGTDTFFVLNDVAATTTFTATDLVIKITGVTGTLDASDITLL